MAAWMGRVAFLFPILLINTRGRWKLCPVVLRVGELSLASASCNTSESRSYTSPEKDNRANPTSAGVRSQPQSIEYAHLPPFFICLVAGMDERKKSPPSPLMLGAGRRADSVVIRLGETSLILTRQHWESKPCTTLG